MRTINAITDYLKRKENTNAISRNNDLIYVLRRDFGIGEEHCDVKRVGAIKINFIRNKKKLLHICMLFGRNDISYITFKGVVLSFVLYGDESNRVVGDIDIYVEQSKFSRALELLKYDGFGIVDDGNKHEHHVVLTNGTVIVELHKNIFNPQININEAYLRRNFVTQTISGHAITTFNETATILHLLYHLYMDVFLGDQFLQATYFHDVMLAKRFLFRAYEIALYSEKYHEQINWTDVKSDILKQKLSPCFKSMIGEILEIFPDIFPESLMQAINSIEYKITPNNIHQLFCSYLSENKGKGYAELMGEFVRLHWDGFTTLSLKDRASFEVPYQRIFKEALQANNSNIQKVLKCTCFVTNNRDGIEICFRVLQGDIYLSDEDNFVEMETDGIHLLLCGANEYSYRSIFLFPKIDSYGTKVIAVDKYSNERIKDIEGNFDIKQEGYIMHIFLNQKFVADNYLDKEFYIGVLVSKCCPNAKKRIRELMMTPNIKDWYDPTRFVKIVN